jgi:hypothetical protein
VQLEHGWLGHRLPRPRSGCNREAGPEGIDRDAWIPINGKTNRASRRPRPDRTEVRAKYPRHWMKGWSWRSALDSRT